MDATGKAALVITNATRPHDVEPVVDPTSTESTVRLLGVLTAAGIYRIDVPGGSWRRVGTLAFPSTTRLARRCS